MASPPDRARTEDSSFVARSVERTVARRRATAEDEVRRLVDACFVLVQEKGSLDPRVGEIVQQARLSNQAFYRYFRSKDELLLAVLDEGVGLLAGYLEHRMSKSRVAERRIKQWLSGVLEQALNRRAAAATRPFVLSRGRLLELFPDELALSEARLRGMLEDAIRQGVEEGTLSSPSPGRDAELIYDLAMGWVERKLAAGIQPKRVDAEHLIAFAIRGLGSPSLPVSGKK